jgi:glycosyltransferase involved in cell wall biosynthesis
MHIVHTEASLGWGGQEVRILTESEGMVGRGHRVTLLCPPQARICEAARGRGLAVTPLPIGRKRLGGLVALYGWLSRNPADVLNTHSSTDAWLAALACGLLRDPPPIVRTRHISAPVPDNAATRWLYGRATSHIVTTGETLRQRLIAVNRLPAGQITSVPTGVDTSRFRPGDRIAARIALSLPPQAPIVGIVATLRSWKGHRYLLEAFAGLARTDAILLIVGDGPQREALERRAAELGIAGRVRFVGNQEDVRRWLAAMDVFALPSYANEGVPQALIQAMLCGLPVVTTPVGSITEIVDHQRTGLIVPPEQVKPLCAKLAEILDDPAQRSALGAAARSFAETHCGMDAMLDRMEAIFRSVARH